MHLKKHTAPIRPNAAGWLLLVDVLAVTAAIVWALNF